MNRSLTRISIVGVIAALSLFVLNNISFAANYTGSAFLPTWRVVKDFGAYNQDALPTFQAGVRTMLGGLFTEGIKGAAKRTVSERSDLLPNFQKLVHANGICFSGTWNITEENPYTGYFAKGSRGMIIARASEAAGVPTLGNYRAFGFAGKIFPTDDPNSMTKYETANFFTIDDLGGTLTQHFTDSAFTNQPAATPNRQALLGAGLLAEVVAAFRLADSHIGERQLYEISELGLADKSQAHTPRFMQIRASAGTNAVDEVDFRRELLLKNHGGRLSFDVLVAADERKEFQPIGNIELTDDALTVTCDHSLHFHHLKWRKDLH